jgi:hypothetical protein
MRPPRQRPTKRTTAFQERACNDRSRQSHETTRRPVVVRNCGLHSRPNRLGPADLRTRRRPPMSGLRSRLGGSSCLHRSVSVPVTNSGEAVGPRIGGNQRAWRAKLEDLLSDFLSSGSRNDHRFVHRAVFSVVVDGQAGVTTLFTTCAPTGELT